MNLSYKILLILLLPIYLTQAMESEEDFGMSTIKITDQGQQEVPTALKKTADSIAQRQSTEMIQDPTGSHRERALTADNPNPASLTRTPTTTTDGSTPTASAPTLPGSIAPSRVPSVLPGLPGLNPLLNASDPDLLASVISPTVFKGPGDDEYNEILVEEAIKLFDKCDFMLSSPRTGRKRIPKYIGQSSDEKSSGGEKSGEEKKSPKKSRSGTGLEMVQKELPTNKKEFYQELISKMGKAFLIKINMIHHDTLYGRHGLAPFYTFFGINMGEKSPVPGNSLSSVVKPVVENALTEYKTAVQKENSKRDCCFYMFMGANLLVSGLAVGLGFANLYS